MHHVMTLCMHLYVCLCVSNDSVSTLLAQVSVERTAVWRWQQRCFPVSSRTCFCETAAARAVSFPYELSETPSCQRTLHLVSINQHHNPPYRYSQVISSMAEHSTQCGVSWPCNSARFTLRAVVLSCSVTYCTGRFSANAIFVKVDRSTSEQVIIIHNQLLASATR